MEKIKVGQIGYINDFSYTVCSKLPFSSSWQCDLFNKAGLSFLEANRQKRIIFKVIKMGGPYLTNNVPYPESPYNYRPKWNDIIIKNCEWGIEVSINRRFFGLKKINQKKL